MPIKSCSRNGKSGFKWGDEGKCFTGPGGREKARKQGVAIKISQKSGKSHLDKLLYEVEKTLDKEKEPDTIEE